MTDIFGVQKTSIYGSFGEFTVGNGSSPIRAKYILTKTRPGNDGTWECELASQMKPWREVFKVEDLNFDELLQRDLDDSRVAHDLIPYLLGDSANRARFFPPILAVIVPRAEDGTGIKKFYPTPKEEGESYEEYEDLFEFEILKVEDKVSPLASLRYNRQRSAFIIVDGQHRAMAVLALHRQLNDDWGNNPFASYYNHIRVTPDQVKCIELPTCIMYFPDLHEGNSNLLEMGVDLGSVCREIFLVVNRSAKRVSESRGLLLDDEDIAAHLMRRTLSGLKSRDEESAGSARIYTVSYGDSDTEIGQKEVISGQLTYSSAIALHKIHRAISFGAQGAFTLNDYSDISDGRRTQNPNRPSEILLGTSVEEQNPLPYNSGRSIPPDQVAEVVNKLGALADVALVRLFDKFRPFEVHNKKLLNLRMQLLDVHIQSDAVQKKAYTLIFEGSGVRNVFDSHFKRLMVELDEHAGDTQVTLDYLQRQITFCKSVQKAMDRYEQTFECHRACSFFGINYEVFFSDDNNHDDRKELRNKSYKLYQTLATQAFQLGYAMAIFTIVEELRRSQPTSSRFEYQKRFEVVQFVTEVYLTALNSYFSPSETTSHQQLTGYIEESRASVFDPDSWGLRGFLKMSVDELNERQWRFFRYAILEIIHSSHCWQPAYEKMKQIESEWLSIYMEIIPKIADGIISERKKYIEDAVRHTLNGNKFNLDLLQQQAHAQGQGQSHQDIEQLENRLKAEYKENTEKDAFKHLEESLTVVETKEEMVHRLSNGLM